MNKAEITDRLAARIGLNKAAARDAVDGVFATIGEALANGEEVRIAGFGDVRCQDPGGPYRPQPPDRRGDLDIGFEVTVVQGGEGTQGCGERRNEGRDRGLTVERDE